MPSEPSAHPTAAPSQFPKIPGFRILREIGVGGMSTVYLAEQDNLHREVAIKVMLPDLWMDEVSRRRFENEARTIARLDHPNIVGIHSVGRTETGSPFYAMPYLKSGHLAQRVPVVDPVRLRHILRAMLEALSYAHSRGVIHRDVKAENVLFDQSDRPLLADFGIALRRGYGPRVTTAGLAVGSTAYMAPEQARGEDVDVRADLYSVGVLAWEMLTGSLPFNAGDAVSMAIKHAKDPVPRLPPQQRQWQRFIDKALAKSPEQRFASAREMLDALEEVPLQAPASLAFALQRVPKSAWAVMGIALAGMIGWMVWDRMPTASPESAPTSIAITSSDAASTTDALPAPGAVDGQAAIAIDPTDAMLREAPRAAIDPLLQAAQAHLRAGNLNTPVGRNAAASLSQALRTDPRHQGLPVLLQSYFKATGAHALDALRSGNDAIALADLQAAGKLAQQSGKSGIAMLDAARQPIVQLLKQRMQDFAKRNDRDGASKTVALGKSLGMSARDIATMESRIAGIRKAGDRVGNTVLVEHEGKLVGITLAPVSRGDYARFAAATSRPPALCRERASLLRALSPRDWKNPGFAQSDADPVVCVSMADATAYAQWLGQREGVRYRIPTGDEARAQPDAGRVGEWLSDCSDGCRKHATLGGKRAGARDSSRGHEDVGFRLVREL